MRFPYPCQDCPDRHPACHDSCEKYQEAKAQHEAIKSAKRRQKKADQDLKGVLLHGKRHKEI